MGKPSVTHQVNEALKAIFSPGIGRHKLKTQRLADERITSIRTMRSYVRSGSQFARWCKDHYGVRDIRQITPEMAERYIGELCDKERSGGYIGRTKAAIRKLDIAMKRNGLRPCDAPPLLQPGGGWHSDRRPERAYSSQQAEQLINDMRARARDKQTAEVAQLQWVAGLRISEAVMIRGTDVDAETCVIHVECGTKGGRPRPVQVDVKYRSFLQMLAARAQGRSDGHVFQGRGNLGAALAQRTTDAVRHACKRLGIEYHGTHGFRKAWAQERYRELCEGGQEDHSARREIARELGHNRIDVTSAYIPR